MNWIDCVFLFPLFVAAAVSLRKAKKSAGCAGCKGCFLVQNKKICKKRP